MSKQILLMQTAGSGGISATAGGVSRSGFTGIIIVIAVLLIVVVLLRFKPRR